MVILTVVIVIALVAVFVLGGLINIGRGTGEHVSRSYWRKADIGLLDWVMDNSGDDTLVVKNNLDYGINITAISVGGTEIDVNDFKLEPGETGTKKGAWFSCITGDTYSLQIIFTYDATGHNVTGKTFTGVKNIEGRCVA